MVSRIQKRLLYLCDAIQRLEQELAKAAEKDVAKAKAVREKEKAARAASEKAKAKAKAKAADLAVVAAAAVAYDRQPGFKLGPEMKRLK